MLRYSASFTVVATILICACNRSPAGNAKPVASASVSIDLESGAAMVRKIALSPEQLGEGQTVELSVVPDKTFVPARLAALQSTDTRQLGVRVFRAFVQPKQ